MLLAQMQLLHARLSNRQWLGGCQQLLMQGKPSVHWCWSSQAFFLLMLPLHGSCSNLLCCTVNPDGRLVSLVAAITSTACVSFVTGSWDVREC